jgi:hypothetical protein
MTPEAPRFLLTGLVDDMPEADQGLIDEVLDMLHEAGLHDVMVCLTGRVLGPIDDGPDGDRRERSLVDEECRLQPAVRGLLLELWGIAARSEWTEEMRSAAAKSAIGLAGF